MDVGFSGTLAPEMIPHCRTPTLCVRLVDAWLIVALAGPVPAWGLRVPNARDAGLEEPLTRALGRSRPSVRIIPAGPSGRMSRRRFLMGAACLGGGAVGPARAQTLSPAEATALQRARAAEFHAAWEMPRPPFAPAERSLDPRALEILTRWRKFQDMWERHVQSGPVSAETVAVLRQRHVAFFHAVRDALPPAFRQGVDTYSSEAFDRLMLERVVAYLATRGVVMKSFGIWTLSATPATQVPPSTPSVPPLTCYTLPKGIYRVLRVAEPGVVEVELWDSLQRRLGMPLQQESEFRESGFAAYGTAFLETTPIAQLVAEEESIIHRVKPPHDIRLRDPQMGFWDEVGGDVWSIRLDSTWYVLNARQTTFRVVSAGTPTPEGYIVFADAAHDGVPYHLLVAIGSPEHAQVTGPHPPDVSLVTPPPTTMNMLKAGDYALQKLLFQVLESAQRFDEAVAENRQHEYAHVEQAALLPALFRQAKGGDVEALAQTELWARSATLAHNPRRFLLMLLRFHDAIVGAQPSGVVTKEDRAVFVATQRFYHALVAILQEEPERYGLRFQRGSAIPLKAQVVGQFSVLPMLSAPRLQELQAAVRQRAGVQMPTAAASSSDAWWQQPALQISGAAAVLGAGAVAGGLAYWRHRRNQQRAGASSPAVPDGANGAADGDPGDESWDDDDPTAGLEEQLTRRTVLGRSTAAMGVLAAFGIAAPKAEAQLSREAAQEAAAAARDRMAQADAHWPPMGYRPMVEAAPADVVHLLTRWREFDRTWQQLSDQQDVEGLRRAHEAFYRVMAQALDAAYLTSQPPGSLQNDWQQIPYSPAVFDQLMLYGLVDYLAWRGVALQVLDAETLLVQDPSGASSAITAYHLPREVFQVLRAWYLRADETAVTVVAPWQWDGKSAPSAAPPVAPRPVEVVHHETVLILQPEVDRLIAKAGARGVSVTAAEVVNEAVARGQRRLAEAHRKVVPPGTSAWQLPAGIAAGLALVFGAAYGVVRWRDDRARRPPSPPTPRAGLEEASAVTTGFVLVGLSALAGPALAEQGIHNVGIARAPLDAERFWAAGLEEAAVIVVGGDPAQFPWTAPTFDEALRIARGRLKPLVSSIRVVTEQNLSLQIDHVLRAAGWTTEQVDRVLEAVRAAVFA